EVGLVQPSVAGTAGVGDRDGLPDGALDPGAKLVGVLELLGVLAGTGLRESVVDVAGADGQLPAAATGGGALGAHGAGPAGVGVELDHDGVGAALAGGAPGSAVVALRAGRPLRVEVDVERGGGEAGPGAGLRTVVGQHRGDQGDAVPVGGFDEEIGRGVAGIDQ